MGIFDFFQKRTATISIPLFSETGYSGSINNNVTYNSCIAIIANAISNLPMNLYRRKSDGSKAKATDVLLYDLVKNNPNASEPPSLFFYSLVDDYFRKGNIFIYLYRDKDKIISMYRINPDSVIVKNNGNRKSFEVSTEKGTVIYDDKSVLHIPSKFGYDGKTGKPISEIIKGTLKASAEIENYMQEAFNNSLGSRLVVTLNTKEELSNEKIAAIQAQMQAKYAGIANAGKPFITDGRYKFENIEGKGVDNRAGQLVELRELEDANIAKAFGIPLAFLQGENKYGGIENLFIMFIEQAIKPITIYFEQSFNRLLTITERSYLYFQYSYDSLMKVDLAARVETYSKQINNGILSVNQILQKENMPGIGSVGDYHFIPSNLLPLTEENVKAFMAGAKAKLIESGIGDNLL